MRRALVEAARCGRLRVSRGWRRQLMAQRRGELGRDGSDEIQRRDDADEVAWTGSSGLGGRRRSTPIGKAMELRRTWWLLLLLDKRRDERSEEKEEGRKR